MKKSKANWEKEPPRLLNKYEVDDAEYQAILMCAEGDVKTIRFPRIPQKDWDNIGTILGQYWDNIVHFAKQVLANIDSNSINDRFAKVAKQYGMVAYTLEEVKTEALKYQTRGDFFIHAPGHARLAMLVDL